MNEDSQIFQKELRFFKLNPQKKTQFKKSKTKLYESFKPEIQKFHDIIREVLKDFQYFSNYQKDQLNLSQGQRVLRTNGVKIIKQNGTFFIQKYLTKEEGVKKHLKDHRVQKFSIVKHKPIQILDIFQVCLDIQRNKQFWFKNQKEYFQYFQLQCYKCPAFGIQIVIFLKWDENQYVLIESVLNFEGKNLVSDILIEKLTDFLNEQSHFNIDPYTLRPKTLKYGVKSNL